MNQKKNGKISEEAAAAIQGLLDRQIELSKEMLAVIRAEQEALVSMNTDSLFSLAGSKSEKLDLLATGDSEIRQKLADIAADHETGLDNAVNLLSILPFLEPEESARIKNKGNRLAELREKIINATIINKEFTANVLEYLEDAVSLIVNGIRENPLYNRQKQGAFDKGRPALLSKEI